MPEFSPGESKTAIVAMSNPTTKPFDYLAELYMGTDLALMASEDFHLEAEGSKDISLPVVMPNTPGTYPVHIGVFSGGKSIGLYKATEDVVIKVEAIVTVALKDYPAMPPDTLWAFHLWCGVDDSKQLYSGAIWDDFDARVTFNIPSDWVFPLRFACDILHYTGPGVYNIILAVQSLTPVYAGYVAEFVPSYGNYYFNVATLKFEKI